MSKAVKEMMTQELASLFEGMDSCLVVRCQGLPAVESNALRNSLHERGLQLRVVKNSIAQRAFERLGLGEVAGLMDGPSAFLTGGDGPVEAAKAFAELRKKQPTLELLGAYVEGELLSPEQANGLAKIPSREVLLAQILAGIQAPLSGMAGVLSGVARQLALVLRATADAKGPAAED